MSKIFVITGHYGSGKTEFAVNFALRNHADVLVDLDIVNPYFRSADSRKLLESSGTRVIASEYVNTNVDIPSVPAEVYSAFYGDKTVVFDVGGNDDGAVALGRFNDKFLKCGYEMYMVVNINRPLTETPEEIIESIQDIELASRLKVTGLVNNTNIMEYTDTDSIMKGQSVLEEVSSSIGVPIVYISGYEDILKQLPDKYRDILFPINIYLRKPWEV